MEHYLYDRINDSAIHRFHHRLGYRKRAAAFFGTMELIVFNTQQTTASKFFRRDYLKIASPPVIPEPIPCRQSNLKLNRVIKFIGD